MNVCKDCKHAFTDYRGWPMCEHPELVDPVTGAPRRADMQRDDELGRCKNEGIYFERKTRGTE